MRTLPSSLPIFWLNYFIKFTEKIPVNQHITPLTGYPTSVNYDSGNELITCDHVALQVSGTLKNTGHDVKFLLDDPLSRPINISGGPMSYEFRITEINLHFGSTDSVGSEHTIDGQAFPAEVRAQPCRTLSLLFRNARSLCGE